MERKTVVDQIECTRNGAVQVRLSKQIVEGDQVLASEYHRTVVEPGVDPRVQMGLVNDHLQAMGCALVTEDDIARVERICQAHQAA